MKKYICAQKCPELDIDDSLHCVITEDTYENEAKYTDYCPCGNREKWEEIKDK